MTGQKLELNAAKENAGNLPTEQLLRGKIPTVRNLRTAKRLLSRLISAFCKGEVLGSDAKTLAFLLSTYVQIIQGAEVEGRLAKLETEAKGNK